MGDRVLIQLKNGDELSPVLYSHWGGQEAPALIDEFHKKFLTERPDDLSYGFARLVGYALRDNIDGTTGFGVWNSKKPLTKADGDEDAGAFLVDIRTLTVHYGGGYKPDVQALTPWKWANDLE